MGVVVAHRAVHLGHQLDAGDGRARRNQADYNVRNLFAHRGGGCCLAVGAA